MKQQAASSPRTMSSVMSSAAKSITQSKPKQRVLSEDQKEERRKAMILAAQTRSTDWDNKYGKGSGKKYAASVVAANARGENNRYRWLLQL